MPAEQLAVHHARLQMLGRDRHRAFDHCVRQREAPEKRPGRRLTGFLVPAGADPPVLESRGRRLADVVQQRTECDRQALVSGERRGVAPQDRGSFVDHHQGVDPYIPLRMPLRILRHADQRVEFGMVPLEQAERAQQLEPPAGAARDREKLHPFLGHALGRQ